jgi:hypothetical protein
MGESQTYKFNIICRLFSYLSGVAISIFGIVVGVVLYIKWKTENMPSFMGIIMCIIIFGWLSISFSLISAPAISFLKIDTNGFIYKSTNITVSGRWVASIFNNAVASVTGRDNLLSPLYNKVKYSRLKYLMKSAEYKDFYIGVIPILFFGGITHKQVKEKIRGYAPYLFGFLLTEAEFSVTLNALDELMSCYINKEIPPQLFFSQYRNFYNKYIVHGKLTVKDFFSLITKYSDRVSYHTAVWNEIIKPQFPNYEEQLQQDINQLQEIRRRYKS